MGNSAQSLSWAHFFFYCRYTVNEIVRIPSFQPSLLSLFFVSLRNYYGWFPKTVRIFLKASHLKDRKFILEKYFRGLRPLPLEPFTLNFCLGRASWQRVFISYPLRSKGRGESGVQYFPIGENTQWPLCLYVNLHLLNCPKTLHVISC